MENSGGIGFSEEERRYAREHPEEFADALGHGLSEALRAVRSAQGMNYDNPIWEPAIGYLEKVIEELGV